MRKDTLKEMYTALITPFNEDFTLDELSLINLLIKQDKSNIDGIVILSTTGEGSTLTIEESIKIITLAKKYFHKDILIGIAENDPYKVINKMKIFDEFSPNGYLICTPFYNKGNEKGIYEFYKLILKYSTYPLILYNVPSRCGYDMPLKLVHKLSKEKLILGIKNASYSYKYYFNLTKLQNKNFKILCGNDDFFFVGINLTNHGLISVSTNLIPNYFASLYVNFQNNYQKFKEDYFALDNLFNYLSLDVNPIMIKELIANFTSIKDILRYPLCKIKHNKSQKYIEKLLKNERIKNECTSNW